MPRFPNEKQLRFVSATCAGRQLCYYCLCHGSHPTAVNSVFAHIEKGSAIPPFLSFFLNPSQTITAGYHGAIKACGNGGQWEEATSLLQRMRQDSVAVVTSKEYNAAILACCRAQQPVAALTLLGDMSVETNCRADETSYILVMRAFGREGR